MLVEDYLRPAAVKAGALAKDDCRRFGFHNLRHSLASFLIRTKTDPKTVQTLLRHSNVKTTLQLYAHSVSEDRLAAQGEALGAFLATADERGGQLIMGRRWVEGNYVITVKMKKRMVGTWGLEPETSTVSILRS